MGMEQAMSESQVRLRHDGRGLTWPVGFREVMLGVRAEDNVSSGRSAQYRKQWPRMARLQRDSRAGR